MTRKFGEHPTDGKGLERVSAALKADSERSQAALASNPLRAEHYATDREWAIALTAEIERLTRVHEQDSAEFRRLDERNDRLRAALLQIRDATVLPGGLTTLTRREMREIAETAVGNEPRARGGSSDETNAFAAELLDVRAICDDRDRFRSLADRAGMLLRSAPIHHYGRAYDRWKLQCEAWRVERETGEPCKHPPEWRTGTQCGLCFADESAVETSTVHGPCPQCGSQWTDVRIMTPVPCKCRAAEKASGEPT